MGWNSWNTFRDTIDDATVRRIADNMVSSGMRDAGYIYVNIDDSWAGQRDLLGNITSNNQRFPDMKGLADYLHARGLKLGLYSSPGPKTCLGYTGSYGHEQQDANTFASWGVDYLKYDWCTAANVYNTSQMPWVYGAMATSLQNTDRPIIFSICQYGLDSVQLWGPKAGGNLWRTTVDISDSWESMRSNIEYDEKLAAYAGPGTWNDPDMLQIGNGNMTMDEYKTQMSLWALSAAPLLASNDLRSMSADTQSILLNGEVIAIDQDLLGKQASAIKDHDLEIWTKPLADGGLAVGVLNLDSATKQTTVNVQGLASNKSIKSVRNLWTHENLPVANGSVTANIASHATLLLRITDE
jgi:alpha-galactosidase